MKSTLQGLMKVFSTLGLAYIKNDLASLRIDDVKVLAKPAAASSPSAPSMSAPQICQSLRCQLDDIDVL